jgi:hypothetical protein
MTNLALEMHPLETGRYHAFVTELEQNPEAVLVGPEPKPRVDCDSNGRFQCPKGPSAHRPNRRMM